jgi:hypothetical protein
LAFPSVLTDNIKFVIHLALAMVKVKAEPEPDVMAICSNASLSDNNEIKGEEQEKIWDQFSLSNNTNVYVLGYSIPCRLVVKCFQF